MVLGDMLELGQQSQSGHSQVVKKAVESQIDWLFLIGTRMEEAIKQLISEGFSTEKIMIFETHEKMIIALEAKLEKGDFVLVKGSQGMRMEKIIEGILENPQEAEESLCRSSKEWRKKPYLKP